MTDMFASGLVSVTLRQLAPEEIIQVVTRAGLDAIEWGGDIHVPPGDPQHAKTVGRWTREAGLMVAAYGSYYRLGAPASGTSTFDHILASAVALGAPTIRVWAGRQGSADCTPDQRRAVVADGLRIAEKAARAGITISLEYHAGTLTDSPESVRALMGELSHPNLELLWQPSNGEPFESCAARLADVLPRLRNVHVFHWWPTGSDRRPLVEGEDRWRAYIGIVRASDKDADFLLEFVADDLPEHVIQDGATLKRWLAAAE